MIDRHRTAIVLLSANTLVWAVFWLSFVVLSRPAPERLEERYPSIIHSHPAFVSVANRALWDGLPAGLGALLIVEAPAVVAARVIDLFVEGDAVHWGTSVTGMKIVAATIFSYPLWLLLCGLVRLPFKRRANSAT